MSTRLGLIYEGTRDLTFCKKFICSFKVRQIIAELFHSFSVDIFSLFRFITDTILSVL